VLANLIRMNVAHCGHGAVIVLSCLIHMHKGCRLGTRMAEQAGATLSVLSA
jgi:hypothetical protein